MKCISCGKEINPCDDICDSGLCKQKYKTYNQELTFELNKINDNNSDSKIKEDMRKEIRKQLILKYNMKGINTQ